MEMRPFPCVDLCLVQGFELIAIPARSDKYSRGRKKAASFHYETWKIRLMGNLRDLKEEMMEGAQCEKTEV